MKIEKNSLQVNAGLNIIKQICGIIFPFITFSYCSRVLGAEKMGMFSFGQSIVSYLLLIAALGVSNYAIREGARIRTESVKLESFVSEVFSINVIMTIAAYIIMVVLLVAFQELKDYRAMILIQSVSVLLTTIGTDYVNAVFEDYFYITVRYIIIQILSICMMFAIVKGPDDIYKYALLATFASYGGNIFNLLYLRKTIRLRFTVCKQMKRHLKPLLILFGNNIASIIYLNSDITMLGIMASDHEVGIYAAATKMYSMIKMLFNAMVQVAIPRFSRYLNEGKKKEYLEELGKVQNVITLFVIPASIGLFCEAENIIRVFVGEEYLQGTLALQILAIAMIFAVEACYLSYAILIPNRMEKYFLMATIAAAIVNAALNLFLIPQFGMNGAAITTFIAEAIICAVALVYARKKVELKASKKVLCQALLGSVLIFICCKAVAMLQWVPLIELMAAIVLSMVLYGGFLLLAQKSMKESSYSIFQK